MGFRPFIYTLAHSFRLTGFVINSARGVDIEAQGNRKTLAQFIQAIRDQAPPLAVIMDISSSPLPDRDETDFTIRTSAKTTAVGTFISPDIATCENCIADFSDPSNRRFGYPFTNCTNCGPRYTIIEDIPYDRPKTSMHSFTLCPECQEEYENPENRRFHAQPNACPRCGPRVTLWKDHNQLVEKDNALTRAADLLRQGFILAIKGLGGFHLVVDATNETAVLTLRKRKLREEKPLALMVGSSIEAEAICRISKEEYALLTSPRRPIVLLQCRPDTAIADAVAPGNDRLGIMLPYTPLHYLLFQYKLPPLVMTSANLSEEPIVKDNSEAFERLTDIADYYLIHDRDIYIRNDDSVTIVLSGKPRLMRRSRGYAPQPILVNSDGPGVLAVGGLLKNTVCILKQDSAILSQHIGDLENLESYRVFEQTIRHLQHLFDFKPDLIVHDLHPGYLSTQWAEQQETLTLGVQHHWAHLAACLAENRHPGPAIGIIMDGTGFGTDGTIWGGEILIGDFSGFERRAHFEPLPLPGGDAAIKEPWRTAVSYIFSTQGEELPDIPFFSTIDPDPILEMIRKDVNCPLTSSCGRLFDAVAAMSGGRYVIRYEGQAAIEFMQATGDYLPRPFDYIIDEQDGRLIWPLAPVIRSVIRDIKQGASFSRLSGRFHRMLVELFTQSTQRIAQETGLRTVVLSGGVFQNQVLFEALIPRLEKAGLNVLTHTLVPANDGGLSLGQTLIGRAYLEQNKQG